MYCEIEMTEDQREVLNIEFADYEFEEVKKIGDQIMTVEHATKTKWEVCVIHPDGSYTQMCYRSTDKKRIMSSAIAEVERMDAKHPIDDHTHSCDVCGGWVDDGEVICSNCE